MRMAACSLGSLVSGLLHCTHTAWHRPFHNISTSPPDTSTAILCSGLLCIVLSAARRVKESAVPGNVSAHTGWNQNQPYQYTNQPPHQVLGLKVPPPPHTHTKSRLFLSFVKWWPPHPQLRRACCRAETPFRAQQTAQPHGHQSEAGPSTALSLRSTEPHSRTHPADMPQIKLCFYRTRQQNTSCKHAPDQTL